MSLYMYTTAIKGSSNNELDAYHREMTAACATRSMSAVVTPGAAKRTASSSTYRSSHLSERT
jgi:hypothetical protein